MKKMFIILMVAILSLCLGIAEDVEIDTCDFSTVCNFVETDDTIETMTGATASGLYNVENTTNYLRFYNDNDTEENVAAKVTVSRDGETYTSYSGFVATFSVYMETGNGDVDVYVYDNVADEKVVTCVTSAVTSEYTKDVSCKWRDVEVEQDFDLVFEVTDPDGEGYTGDVLVYNYGVVWNEDAYGVDFSYITEVIVGLLPLFVVMKLIGGKSLDV